MSVQKFNNFFLSHTSYPNTHCTSLTHVNLLGSNSFLLPRLLLSGNAGNKHIVYTSFTLPLKQKFAIGCENHAKILTRTVFLVQTLYRKNRQGPSVGEILCVYFRSYFVKNFVLFSDFRTQDSPVSNGRYETMKIWKFYIL